MQNKPIWVNTEESISKSSLYKFIRLIAQKYNFLDDSNFYQWSIDYPELFWQEFMDYSKIILDSPAEEILKRSVIFQNNRWFYKAKLNFARNLLDSKYNQIRDNLEPNYPALIALNEKGETKSLGIKELKNQVAQLVLYFKSKGVKTGDRIAGFIPNISEAVISMLAATSLGAVWTACSPDFGEDGVLERFFCVVFHEFIILKLKQPRKNLGCFNLFVRVERIELSSPAWKAGILPLNYTRLVFYCFVRRIAYQK